MAIASEWERIVEHLTDEIVDLKMQIAELNRRMNNVVRPGRVTKTKRGESKAAIAYDLDDDGNDVETTDVDWATPSAGRIKISNPPSVGEQGLLFSPSGDIDESSIFLPASIWSDDNKDPHNAEGEMKTTIDDKHSDLMTKDKRVIEVDEFRVKAKKIILEADEVHLGGEGGKLLHRKGDQDSAGHAAVGSATKVFAV
jgi:phage baseplate assembly protein V